MYIVNKKLEQCILYNSIFMVAKFHVNNLNFIFVIIIFQKSADPARWSVSAFFQADFAATSRGPHSRASEQHVPWIHSLSIIRRLARLHFSWATALFCSGPVTTLFRRLFSRVVCYSNMGKRSRQRQKNQNAGRDNRDTAVSKTPAPDKLASVCV